MNAIISSNLQSLSAVFSFLYPFLPSPFPETRHVYYILVIKLTKGWTYLSLLFLHSGLSFLLLFLNPLALFTHFGLLFSRLITSEVWTYLHIQLLLYIKLQIISNMFRYYHMKLLQTRGLVEMSLFT